MKPQNENLHIWKQVEKTNPDWLKSVSTGGRKFKAVNPQKQLKQATELFGPYGSTWGLRNCKRSFIDFENQTKMMFLECEFFYPGGCFDISNSLEMSYIAGVKTKNPYLKIDNEAPKKLETNTVSKALSKLGFASDVFEGRFEEQGYEKLNKYTQDFDFSQAYLDAAKKQISLQTESIPLIALWNKNQRWHESQELVEFYQQELSTLQQITD